MGELWDILDEYGNQTGRVAERSDKLRGLVSGYHLVVHIYIVNSKNEWLIQKRSLTKELWPGIWDITGGGVLSGEDSLTAALRETKEEVGITFDHAQIHLEKRLMRKDSFADIWVLRADFDLNDCAPDPAEVDELRWVSGDEMVRLVFGGAFRDETYIAIVEDLVKKYAPK